MVGLSCEGILDACQACLARCVEAQIFSLGTNFRSQNVENVAGIRGNVARC